MKNRLVLQIIAIVLSFSAAHLSYMLVKKHLTGSTGSKFLDGACSSEDTESKASCDKVLASDYGVFPFKPPIIENDEHATTDTADDEVEGADGGDVQMSDVATGEPEQAAPQIDTESLPVLLRAWFGVQTKLFPPNFPAIPVAIFGVGYYSLVAVWLIGIGRPSYSRRWLHCILMFVSVCSFLGCLFFIYIMFTVSEAWCPLCMWTHCLNFALLICIFFLRPTPDRTLASASTSADSSEGSEDGADQAEASKAQAVEMPVFPDGRRILITIVAMLFVMSGTRNLHVAGGAAKSAISWKSGYDRCFTELNQFLNDSKSMIRNWREGEKRDIPLREDDSVRGGKPDQMGVKCIVFSDFECPACRSLAHFLDREVQPMFDGNLKIIFKHYPLDKECNPAIKKSMHPHACKAAAFVETARLQGGNEAFWKAHDYFFVSKKRVTNLSEAEFTAALGLDAERFHADLSANLFKDRLVEDIKHGVDVKLRSTPGVFLSGKQVRFIVAKDLDFWDEAANMYWRAIRKPRPEHTKLKKTSTAGKTVIKGVPADDAKPEEAATPEIVQKAKPPKKD